MLYGELEQIDDNYPKLVLSLDHTWPVDRSGIKWQNMVDFLLADDTVASAAQ